MTRQSDYGMPSLILQLVSLCKLTIPSLLLTLWMDGSPEPHPQTPHFNFGTPTPVLQLPNLWTDTMKLCYLLPTLPPHNLLSLDPLIGPWLYVVQFYQFLEMFPPRVIKSMLRLVLSTQTQMAGSKTLRVAYYIGCPKTVVRDCIHPLS